MRQTTRWAPVLAGSLLLFGCGENVPQPGSAVPQVPDWRLGDRPAVDIGVAEGDEGYELAGASGSVRLADGRIVIANSATNELRVFDSIGQFTRTISRRGEGPGEFAGSMQVVGMADGTFAVFDQGNLRLSVFDTSGSPVGESRVTSQGVSDFPLWVWLHRNAWVAGPVDTSLRAGVGTALDALPSLSAGSYRYVQIATDGRIWSQERTSTPGDSRPWEIFSSSGVPMGRIVIPDGTEIHQVGRDFILLRHWGENDVEHIQLYRFEERETERVVTAGERTAPLRSEPAVEGSVRETLATAIRNLVMAQEMYYGDNGSYAGNASVLTWETAEGASLHLMAADKRGWVGVLVHQTQPMLCGMAVGESTPPGWMEGSPKCSR